MKKLNEFPKAAKIALEHLHNKGFEGYLIGGSVRDFLMNTDIGDVDITTNATPEKVKDVFSNFRVIETGIKHGTVTVIIENEPVEITTYRSEGTYSDNRHPDSVTFSKSLADDVTRRDFTMNGIAYNFTDGIVDLVNGKKDIENKTIRAIGDAKTRFQEDALRILRALRFSSVLGFDIEENTRSAIFECKDLLLNISAERIRDEFIKLVCGENAGEVLSEYASVFAVIIPEINGMIGFEQKNRHHIYDVYTHSIKALEQGKREKTVRLALFFHDIGKPLVAHFDENGEQHYYGHPKKSAEITEEILTRLRFDNDTKNKVLTLVKLHDTPILINDETTLSLKRIKKLMSQIGKELIYDLIEVKRCDNLAQNPKYYRGDDFYESAVKAVDEIINEKQCFCLKDLNVSGNDLIKIGYSGKEIGKALDRCLNAVMDGKIQNVYENLIDFLRK